MISKSFQNQNLYKIFVTEEETRGTEDSGSCLSESELCGV